GWVHWISTQQAPRGRVTLAARPIDIGPELKEALFDKVDCAVLTSATLTAGADEPFAFMQNRLGLDDAETCSLGSPFDYREQCLFGVPDDIPDPREDQGAHDQAVCRVVVDLAHASGGGMFVLFTSHAALRRVAAEVRGMLGTRWPLLVQGEAPREALLKRFRDAGNGILLGTDSFWEGVDVPGNALRALVLTKLPFKVPTEPVTAARLERLAEQGIDGFMHYLLPHAALKLKQGFGRLIRSRRDVGVVLLLDPRVSRKRYGPLMLESLPPADRATGSWAEILTRCEDFFARHGLGEAWPGMAEHDGGAPVST
ncbi:MAG: ATP-dependent DNA helicase, partial [Gemmatimonadetes bacterium]|nr:ATP-dependent DNA helicase [Gemmatimonadota bacterium]